MKSRLFLYAGLFLTFLTTSSAVNGQPQKIHQTTNNKADQVTPADIGRGKSVALAEEKIRQKSKSLDKNNNGVFDREEIDAKKSKLGILAGFAEKALDQNGDGIITSEEYVDVQISEIKKSDKNHDGYIDEQEERQRKKEIIKMALGL